MERGYERQVASILSVFTTLQHTYNWWWWLWLWLMWQVAGPLVVCIGLLMLAIGILLQVLNSSRRSSPQVRFPNPLAFGSQVRRGPCVYPPPPSYYQDGKTGNDMIWCLWWKWQWSMMMSITIKTNAQPLHQPSFSDDTKNIAVKVTTLSTRSNLICTILSISKVGSLWKQQPPIGATRWRRPRFLLNLLPADQPNGQWAKCESGQEAGQDGHDGQDGLRRPHRGHCWVCQPAHQLAFCHQVDFLTF